MLLKSVMQQLEFLLSNLTGEHLWKWIKQGSLESDLNTLHLNVRMHILHTVLYTFLKVPRRRIF